MPAKKKENWDLLSRPDQRKQKSYGLIKGGVAAIKVTPKNWPEELKDWAPNDKMKAWLRAASDPNVKGEIASIGSAAGVPISNWYRWVEDDQFMFWWRWQWKNVQARIEYLLDKITIDMAKKKGGFKYLELWQTKHGSLSQKVEINTGNSPFSAGIFVTDFKQALREPVVQIQANPVSKISDKVVEGVVIPETKTNASQDATGRVVGFVEPESFTNVVINETTMKPLPKRYKPVGTEELPVLDPLFQKKRGPKPKKK
jgi:hypothetical protein